MLDKKWETKAIRLLIETPKPRGMPTAGEEMETLIHIGRFIQTWSQLGGRYSYVFRQEVKLHICGSARAKDPNVNQAIRDMFGGDSQAGKKCSRCKGKGWFGAGRPVCDECHGSKWEALPGPLAGVTNHTYAAIALGIWWKDEGKVQQRIINPNQHKKKPKVQRKPKTAASIGG